MAKPDEGHILTEKALAKLEKKIESVYGEAAKEMQTTIDEYFSSFAKRDEEMKSLIGSEVNGKEWTKEDYINAKISAASADGSHESGLDYVPFDGYIAELHKGERVLTAEEAAAYRAGKDSTGGGSGGFVINQYIQTPVETPAELAAATEAYFQQARWAVAL